MIFNNNNVEAWVKMFLGRVGEEEEMSEEDVQEVVEQPVEKKGRWKSVVETSGKEAQTIVEDKAEEEEEEEEEEEDVDGMPMEEEDVDGEPMEQDVDGEPMDDEDVDGQPMDEEDVDGVPMEEPLIPPSDNLLAQEPARLELPQEEPPPQIAEHQDVPTNANELPRPKKRQRMRAADMFTDD